MATPEVLIVLWQQRWHAGTPLPAELTAPRYTNMQPAPTALEAPALQCSDGLPQPRALGVCLPVLFLCMEGSCFHGRERVGSREDQEVLQRGEKGIRRSQVNGRGEMGPAGGKGTVGRDVAAHWWQDSPCTLLLAAVCSQDQDIASRENIVSKQGR